MSFSLDDVVPWGRSYGEYVSMFSLSDEDTEKGFSDAGMVPQVSMRFSPERGAGFSRQTPFTGTPRRRSDLGSSRPARPFSTRRAKTPTSLSGEPSGPLRIFLGRARLSAMEGFLSDFPRGLREGRYVDASLPVLPFPDRVFDLALCSHFLFLYSEHLSLEFHVRSIVELCRVAPTVRIFPLLELGAQKSRHLDPVLSHLTDKGYSLSIIPVDYEFQKGGNRMLEVTFPA